MPLRSAHYAATPMLLLTPKFCAVPCLPLLQRQVAPVVGGVGYLGALFVQQALPELFIFAYPLAVAVFAIPIVFIIVAT